MAWAGLSMFTAYVADCVTGTDDIRNTWMPPVNWFIALFDAATTPDPDAPRPETYRGAGVWGPAREVSGPGWPAGGYTNSPDRQYGPGGDGGGLWSPGGLNIAGVTVAGIAGDLMYYRPAGRGACFHDFGGLVYALDGTLRITWPAQPAGCFRICAS